MQSASMTGMFKRVAEAKARLGDWAKRATAARIHVSNIKRMRRSLEHASLATDDLTEEEGGAATELQELRRRRDENRKSCLAVRGKLRAAAQ